jgi:hypothetical protein
VRTRAKWRADARAKGQFLPGAKAGPQDWTCEDELAAVIETASLNEVDLGAYCRRRGIHAEQLAVWQAPSRPRQRLGPGGVAPDRAGGRHDGSAAGA